MSNDFVPEVGMGVTHYGWTDRHPYTIIKISNSGKLLTIQADNANRVDSNGMSDSQEYNITPNPLGSIIKISKRKNGKYCQVGDTLAGDRYGLGMRLKYYDYNF